MTRRRPTFPFACARFALGFVTLTASATTSTIAFADTKAVCLDAHADAQVLRKAGKLRAARDKLGVCAVASCPSLVTNDCAAWLTEVEAAQPTIVVRVANTRGEGTLDGRLSADGELLAEKLEGTAVPLDPGEHILRVELADGSVTTRRVIVTEGQKNQLVEITFRPPERVATATPMPPAPYRQLPVGFYVASGAAALSLGVFSAFAISGLARESELMSSCAPACAQRDIDELARRYLVADVALAVSFVAAGVAAWLFFSRPSPSDPGRTATFRAALSF